MKENMRFATGLVTRKQVFKDMDVEEVAMATFATTDHRMFTVTSSFVEHRRGWDCDANCLEHTDD